MKKFLFGAIFIGIIVIIFFNIKSDIFYNNPLRKQTGDSEKKIEQIKKKVTLLEKDDIKNIKNINQLADQYSQLGYLYIQKKLWDQAIDAYSKAISNGKNQADMNYSLGLAYANRGKETLNNEDFEKAELFYRKSLAIEKNFFEASYALAILLFYHRNQKSEAIAILEDLIKVNKKHYMSRFALAKFAYEIGDPFRSLDLYESLYADLEKAPNSNTITEYKSQCRKNIQRLMEELSQKKE
jgi:tetratricopeptide (TPR) repeat protein